MFKNNPIFFKDLLIALNSKQWKAVIFFFMFIYFIAFLIFLSAVKYDFGFYRVGIMWKDLFQTLWIAQLLALTGIWFLRWLQSFSAEKVSKTLDFIKISPLTPFQFVMWKLLASVSFILLLFVISLPFLSIALVLGWVNISDILVYSLYTVSYVFLSVLFWMFFSSVAKNTIFSLLIGVLWALILLFYVIFFLGYTADFMWFDFPNKSENILFSLFPVTLFTYISDTDRYIDFFNFKIHYLFFHLYFFVWINGFLFYYITQQYKRFSNTFTKAFNYVSAVLLAGVFLILSSIYSQAIEILLFCYLVLISILYLFNDHNNYWTQKLLNNNYSFLTITLLISAIILFAFEWFSPYVSIFLLSVFLFIYSIFNFIKSAFYKSEAWIINTLFLLILILFFYAIPLISTNLLQIEYKSINHIFKTASYQDNLLEYNCKPTWLKINKNKWLNFEDDNYYKCKNINKSWIQNYIFLYLLLSLILIGGAFILNKRYTKKFNKSTPPN